MDLYKNKYHKYKKKYLKLKDQYAGNNERALEAANIVLQKIKNYKNTFTNENIIKYMEDLEYRINDLFLIPEYSFDSNYILELEQITNMIINFNDEKLSESEIINTITWLAQNMIYQLKEVIKNNNKLLNKDQIVSDTVIGDTVGGPVIGDTVIGDTVGGPVIGGPVIGGPVIGNQTRLTTQQKYNLEFIARGGFGCVISPPILFNDIIRQDYPDSDKIFNVNSLDKNYVGKLLSCGVESYRKELNEYTLVENFDKNGDYTPKLIFAGYMNRQQLVSFIERDNQNTPYGSDLNRIYNCLLEKLRDRNGSNYENYGYIISTKVGKSFELLSYNEINKSNIKQILESLNDGIKNFIKKLYDNNYVHGDIKLPNMTLKNNKVYFIDFGLVHQYTDKKTNSGTSLNFHYPFILNKFYNIMDKVTKPITKRELIIELYMSPIKNENHNYHNNLLLSFLLTNFKGNRRSNSEISNFIIDYYSNLLKDLQDNIQYDINYIYTNHILPIAKNSDIHALSLFIYDIFFGINFKNIMASNFIGQNTTNLVNNLLEDALYNRINGPVHLSNKLDEIINSIY
jgi:hypothetical protein